MLDLIASILNYICNFVRSGIRGAHLLLQYYQDFCLSLLEDAIEQEYPERIRDFKDKFAKARQIFNESLQVEILKGVDSLGE